METSTISPKQRRHRKFLLILPLLTLPFVTMAFWTLGGGKGQEHSAGAQAGLNTNLPSPDFKDEQERGKMELYAMADKDSLRRKEQLAKDPFYKMAMDLSIVEGDTLPPVVTSGDDTPLMPEKSSSKRIADPNEEKVMRKLAELNRALEQSVQEPVAPPPSPAWQDEPQSNEAGRLAAMMQDMNSSASQPDPQMEQMESMLDKILEIQHPERATEKTKELSLQNKQQIYPVVTTKQETCITLLKAETPRVHRSVYSIAGSEDSINIPLISFDEDSLYIPVSNNTHEHSQTVKKTIGFYGLNQEPEDNNLQNAIEAVVAETQTLVSGSTLKLQLKNGCYIAGQFVPAGQYIYGQVNLSGERLEVAIPSIKAGNNIMPVALNVYDMDGLAGIYMPGAISRDVAKNSADQAIQGINFMNYDPSLASQATSAGITAAKTLFSRKAKLVRVTVKAGYRVLLRDNNQNS